MKVRETARLRKQLDRVVRFAEADGWKLMQLVEDTTERNCNGISQDVFFPSNEEWAREPAKLRERAKIADLCHGCPVADECLAGALLRGERFGGWGGVAQPDFQELGRLWRRKRDEIGDDQEEVA